MKRNSGSPGRLEVGALAPAPAHRFVEHKPGVLWPAFVVTILIIGAGFGALALYQLGAHLVLIALAHGGR